MICRHTSDNTTDLFHVRPYHYRGMGWDKGQLVVAVQFSLPCYSFGVDTLIEWATAASADCRMEKNSNLLGWMHIRVYVYAYIYIHTCTESRTWVFLYLLPCVSKLTSSHLSSSLELDWHCYFVWCVIVVLSCSHYKYSCIQHVRR